MASAPHGADANGKWVVAVTAPDVCVVGGKPTPFDTSAILSSWDPANPETRIRALMHPVYRVDDKMLGVLGNAGSGQVSGVSLGTGYVTIQAPSPPTRVVAAQRQIVVDQTPVMVNTNASGGGGTPGKIYTDVAAATGATDAVLSNAERAAKVGELAVSRSAPRSPNGRFMSRANWDAQPVRQRVSTAGIVAKPGLGSTARVLRGGAKVLGPVGTVVGAVDGAASQLATDAARTDLSTTQRAGRAATRSAAKTGGAAVGAWAGAKAGALAGVWFGPWGAVAGGVIGGIAGGIAGSMAGDNVADAVLDQPFAGGR